MSIIRVYAPDQSPESNSIGPNTAAAVMGAMLAKASEPIEMIPVKPAKAKTEKTRPSFQRKALAGLQIKVDLCPCRISLANGFSMPSRAI